MHLLFVGIDEGRSSCKVLTFSMRCKFLLPRRHSYPGIVKLSCTAARLYQCERYRTFFLRLSLWQLPIVNIIT